MEWFRGRTHGFLRWTEQYTRTDMVYAAKGGFWLGIEKSASLLAGFLLAVMFANFMEPEKYGVYKYILSLVSIAGAFSLMGIGTAINQAVARGYEGALRDGFKTSLRWSIGMVLIAFAGAAYYFLNGNTTLGISLLIGGSFSPFIAAFSLYDNFLAGKERFQAKSVFTAIRNITPVLVLVPALFITNEPVVFVALYFISNAVTLYFLYSSALARYKPNAESDRETAHYSKHLSVMNIMDVIASQLDRVLAFSQLGGTALAVYSFAELIPDQIRSLNGIVGTLAFSKVSRQPIRVLQKTLPRKAFILFGAGVILAGTYILLAEPFFSIFFPKYMEAVPYSQVYALTILALPSVLFAKALIGHMRKKELYILKIASPVIRIGLMLVLLPIFGLWGIVWAILISYVLGGILQSILFFSIRDTA